MADTNPAERLFTVTVGRGAKASIGLERRTLTMEALWERLRNHAVAPKENSEFIIPGHVDECPEICRQSGKHGLDCGGGQVHRLALNVRSMELLFLDFDNWNAAELESALAAVAASGFRYLCYSSPSYAPPDKAKVRMVFPLSAPYQVKDSALWRDSVWPALVRMVGLPDADQACSDVSRLYYLPTKREDTSLTFLQEGGTKMLEVPAPAERQELISAPLRLVPPSAPRAASSAELIAQLRADTDFPEYVELVERVADGAPLATDQGGRHPAIRKVTWLLARLNPRPTEESVEALLSPSCAAMGEERDFLSEALRAYAGACDKQEAEAPEVQDFKQRMEEQAGTDMAFAQRLIRERGGDARFLPRIGWHVWDGTRFESWGDRPLALVASLRESYESDLASLRARISEMDEQLKANGTAATMLAQDYTRKFADKRNRLAEKADKFYKNCIRPTQSTASGNAILRMAEDMQAFRTDPNEFDSDGYALNCANGIVDLRTGELRPHDPAAMCTKLAPVAYDPNAKAPLFERVLSEALPDAEVRGFFQRVLGYSLTGDVEHSYLFLLLGSGGNGKSTLLNAFKRVMGDYAGTAPKTLLMTAHRNAAPKSHELAELRGKRIVSVMELNEREHLDSSRLKTVVGGDPISADRKHENVISFITQAKIIMPCNSLPRITDDDNGPWRRIAIIEFPSAFLTEDKIDRTLSDRLKGEAEGILAWAVRGCLEWSRGGLNVPEKCRRAVEEYREHENDVAQYVNECVERGNPGDLTHQFSAGTLHQRYQEWAKAQGHFPMGKPKFKKRMEALGFQQVKQERGHVWVGIKAVRMQ